MPHTETEQVLHTMKTYGRRTLVFYEWLCDQMVKPLDIRTSAIKIRLPFVSSLAGANVGYTDVTEIDVVGNGRNSADVYVARHRGEISGRKGKYGSMLGKVFTLREDSSVPNSHSHWIGYENLDEFMLPNRITELMPFLLVRYQTSRDVNESLNDFVIPITGITGIGGREIVCRVLFNDTHREKETVKVIYREDRHGPEESIVNLRHSLEGNWEIAFSKQLAKNVKA